MWFQILKKKLFKNNNLLKEKLNLLEKEIQLYIYIFFSFSILLYFFTTFI